MPLEIEKDSTIPAERSDKTGSPVGRKLLSLNRPVSVPCDKEKHYKTTCFKINNVFRCVAVLKKITIKCHS